MIIDNHVHIGKTEKSERYFNIKDYHKLMKKNNIDKAVIMPNLSNIRETPELNNVFLLKDRLQYQEVQDDLFPFLLIDGKYKNEIQQQISKYSDYIYGLKYHPSIMESEITNRKLNDFFELASAYNLPVLVHCGRHRRSHIFYITKIAKKFKQVNFIAAHMGGGATDLIEEAITLLKKEKLDNIYLDTSASKLPWLIEEAVKHLGSDKIIYGSDEPYADIRIGKICVELADISDNDKELIFGKNLLNIIKVNNGNKN